MSHCMLIIKRVNLFSFEPLKYTTTWVPALWYLFLFYYLGSLKEWKWPPSSLALAEDVGTLPTTCLSIFQSSASLRATVVVGLFPGSYGHPQPSTRPREQDLAGRGVTPSDVSSTVWLAHHSHGSK